MPDVNGEASPFELLTRLFLRRFVENDLVSPHTDRREALAVTLGVILAVSLFVTCLLSYGYLAAFILLPGVAAVSALGDRFLFIAASMVICALGALAVWDGLALERRDAYVLGPLPISVRTITGAKLTAAGVFGCVLAAAWNTLPTTIYSICLTANVRGVHGLTVLRLSAAQGAIAALAGVSAFFGITAIRSGLRIILGERRFPRASIAAQSALVVFMITALLLALRVRAADVSGWLSPSASPPISVSPVLWYLSLNEQVAGHRVADAPIVLPPLIRSISPRALRRGEAARETYRSLSTQFAVLARRGCESSLLILVLALSTFLWTNRRLPDHSARAPRVSRARAGVRALAEHLTRRDEEAQAGFFFAIHTLTRSAPHRTILAVALAVGVTHAFVVLAHLTSIGALAISTMLALSLAAGFAYAVTVPAEISANWSIRMAWLGDERAYLRGVKRAGFLLVSALLMLLFPIYAAVLGTATAAVHLLSGLAFASVALDVLLLRFRKLPFACGHVPFQNPKFAWPAGLVGLVLVTYVFALIEWLSFASAPREAALAVALIMLAGAVKLLDSAGRRERETVDFAGRPAPLTQRLGLSAHIGAQD